jgi:nucleoside-diphosphate-sugar epimerase
MPEEFFSMNILIVGCGYLGQPLAVTLRSRGDAVFATTRKPERAESFRQMGIEPVLCDVTQPQNLPTVDAVVYAVGMDRSSGLSMRQVYVDGLRNVLAALPGTPRIVYVSSTGVYGQTQGELIDESASTQPLEDSGQVVLAAENVLRESGREFVILRFTGIYGPGRLLRQRDLLAGNPLAIDPEKWINLIHLEDGMSGVLAALERGRVGEVYHICDNEPVRRRDFYTFLAQALKAAAPMFVPVPQPVSAGERVNRRISNAKMRQELGVTLRYPSYREGVMGSLG